MDEALKINPSATHLRVMIPARLEDYIVDYHTNWTTAPITKKDVDALAELLIKIKKINPTSILEMPNSIITQKDYDIRSEQEVIYTDEVFAFHVNNSTGTQHTIDAAKKAGRVIAVHKKYTI